jgi:nitrate reductase gamma subunit
MRTVRAPGLAAALAWLSLCLALCLATPAGAQETPAGKAAMQPPAEGFRLRPCLDCHRLPNLATNEGALASNALCLECHRQKDCARQAAGRRVSLQVEPEKDFRGSRHQYVACLSCHHDVGRSPHRSLEGVRCAGCHPPHGEGDFGGPHLSSRCEACHHRSPWVKLDPATGLVGLARVNRQGEPVSLVDHRPSDYRSPELCGRCHAADNRVGAPAAVLPPKGAVCFLCHTASLSAGGPWLGLALLVFLAGLAAMAWFWLRGSVAGQEGSLHDKLARGSERLVAVVFSREFWRLAGAVFFDVLLQRRLLQESVQRWFFHTLIYWSVLSRLVLGVFTWLVWQAAEGSELAVALIDKNHGFAAFFHDLTGLLLLLGVLLSALQRVVWRPRHVETTSQDALALALLGLVAVLGFAVEAVRLAAGALPPEGAVYAFVAYPLSRLMAGAQGGLAQPFAWLWWAHALAGAALVAYLPFSKMRHVITTPLSLVMNRGRR